MTGETTVLGEGNHYDHMTRKTAMVTTMQDRLQERSDKREPTTSLDYIIRQTDWLRLKLLAFLAQKAKINQTKRLAPDGSNAIYIYVYMYITKFVL